MPVAWIDPGTRISPPPPPPPGGTTGVTSGSGGAPSPAPSTPSTPPLPWADRPSTTTASKPAAVTAPKPAATPSLIPFDFSDVPTGKLRALWALYQDEQRSLTWLEEHEPSLVAALAAALNNEPNLVEAVIHHASPEVAMQILFAKADHETATQLAQKATPVVDWEAIRTAYGDEEMLNFHSGIQTYGALAVAIAMQKHPDFPVRFNLNGSDPNGIAKDAPLNGSRYQTDNDLSACLKCWVDFEAARKEPWYREGLDLDYVALSRDNCLFVNNCPEKCYYSPICQAYDTEFSGSGARKFVVGARLDASAGIGAGGDVNLEYYCTPFGLLNQGLRLLGMGEVPRVGRCGYFLNLGFEAGSVGAGINVGALLGSIEFPDNPGEYSIVGTAGGIVTPKVKTTNRQK